MFPFQFFFGGDGVLRWTNESLLHNIHPFTEYEFLQCMGILLDVLPLSQYIAEVRQRGHMSKHQRMHAFSKINSICKCCNISVNTTIDAQVQALLSVICAARFHAHVSLAGKEGVTLSVRSGGTNR